MARHHMKGRQIGEIGESVLCPEPLIGLGPSDGLKFAPTRPTEVDHTVRASIPLEGCAFP